VWHNIWWVPCWAEELKDLGSELVHAGFEFIGNGIRWRVPVGTDIKFCRGVVLGQQSMF
jgi:hypothetical protein